MGASLPEVITPGDLGDEVAAFLRSMKRENVSPNTLSTYGTACRLFAEWLVDNGRPTDVDKISRRDVEEREIGLRERGAKPATVHNRSGLQRFFSWYAGVLLRDDERSTYRSPMAAMKPPRLPPYQPRVLTLDELKDVLRAGRIEPIQIRRAATNAQDGAFRATSRVAVTR